MTVALAGAHGREWGMRLIVLISADAGALKRGWKYPDQHNVMELEDELLARGIQWQKLIAEGWKPSSEADLAKSPFQ